MKKFNELKKLAGKRKSGTKALSRLLPKILSKEELVAKRGDRFLAMMCKCVKQAVFNWKVIDNKWPQFEEAFYDFRVEKLITLMPEERDAYLRDKRVVRKLNKF